MAYSQEEKDKVFDRIIKHIEEGKSIRQTLQLGQMPSSATFYEWLEADNLKAKRYARACEDRADAMADDMLEIADEQVDDIITDEEGNVRLNVDVVQRARLRVDTRKWLLAKLHPKKYGDKIQHSGDSENPVKHSVDINIVESSAPVATSENDIDA